MPRNEPGRLARQVDRASQNVQSLPSYADRHDGLIAFLVTGFEGHYPVGTAAVVYATDREHCKWLLRTELAKQNLGGGNPDHWTITPLTPVPSSPVAHVVLNGDY